MRVNRDRKQIGATLAAHKTAYERCVTEAAINPCDGNGVTLSTAKDMLKVSKGRAKLHLN